jgi:hypothetical protein
MPFSFTLTDIIPATPQQIYDAWLDSRGHTKMTGSAARAKPVEGATFFAWGGYIKGKNLTLEPGRRIVQSKCCCRRVPRAHGSRCTTPTFRTAMPAIRMADGSNITLNL